MTGGPKDLIQYRIQRSIETLAEAKLMFECYQNNVGFTHSTSPKYNQRSHSNLHNCEIASKEPHSIL